MTTQKEKKEKKGFWRQSPSSVSSPSLSFIAGSLVCEGPVKIMGARSFGEFLALPFKFTPVVLLLLTAWINYHFTGSHHDWLVGVQASVQVHFCGKFYEVRCSWLSDWLWLNDGLAGGLMCGHRLGRPFPRPWAICYFFFLQRQNSRHFSFPNISVEQYGPSPLSVCTVCVCVHACVRVCILHIVMLEHLMSTLNNIVQPKKRSYFASHLIFSCFSPFTCWLSVVL